MSERETPTGDPEADADPRVLALLQRGMPENGVDLAPWWRANVAAEAAPKKSAAWSLQTWMQFAALFILGTLVGVAGAGGWWSAPGRTGDARACRYNEQERAAFTAVLSTTEKVQGADWAPKRTMIASLCSTCHDQSKLCRYNEKERAAFKAVLSTTEKACGADWPPRKTVMVTLCSSCHSGNPNL